MKKILFLLTIVFIASCAHPNKDFYPGAFNQQKETWTWMIYLNADNNLEGIDVSNINQLLAVEPDENINIVILWDRSIYKDRLIQIKNQEIIDLKATINGKTFPGNTAEEIELHMTNPQTLRDFLAYVKENFKTDRYAITFWSHSDGWRQSYKGIGADENDGDPLTVNDGDTVLKNEDIGSALLFAGEVDVVAFDSCLQGSIETLWAMQGADYLIASPHNVPGSGWNYYDFLKKFQNSYMRVDDFLSLAVQSYKNYYDKKSSWEHISLVAYDLSKVNKQEEPGTLKNFFIWLHDGGSPIDGEKEIFLNSYAFNDIPIKQVDLYEYIQKSQYFSDPDFKPALLKQLKSMVVYSWVKGKEKNYPAFSIAYPGVIEDTYYTDIPFGLDTKWLEICNRWRN